MKNLFNKYQKSDWKCDDFGRGKTRTSRSRHRRAIKKIVLRKLKKELDDDVFVEF